MLKLIVVCDVCKKEGDRFLTRALLAIGWTLDTSITPKDGVHVCSKECAVEYDTATIMWLQEQYAGQELNIKEIATAAFGESKETL